MRNLTTLQPFMPSPRVITYGLSGFGPRNAQFVINLALVLLTLRTKLAAAKEKGVDFKIHLTIFEKQDEAATGNAFQTNCDAAANTGVTGLPAIRDVDKVDPIFSALGDHAQNVATRLEANSDKILSDLRRRNPIVAVLLKRSFSSEHKLNTSTACCTRGEWGRVLVESMRSALEYIAAKMPELCIDIRYNHETTGVDFTNPQRPRLLVKKGGGAPTPHEFDFVTLAHGTPLVSPVSAEVGAKAYSLTPNHDTMRDYLSRQDLLDDDGYILPGKSIALTGLSLSAYDYATLLLPFLRGFQLSESNPAGFEFDSATAVNYRGLITFVSRKHRGPAPPRIAPDHTWHGKTSLLSTLEMHALRLQRNFDWMSPAYSLLSASVAHSIGNFPVETGDERTVAEYMESYYQENADCLTDQAVTSETALLRAGSLALSIGSGLELDPDLAEHSLVSSAPLTREGRVGWPMYTASASEISSPCNMYSQDNAAYYGHWDHLHHFIAASPVLLQNSVASLFHHHIAVHQAATFDQFELSKSTGKVSLAGREFDALFAPKSICREADRVLLSMKGVVKEIHDGVPDYGKGMHLQTVDGKPINAFDAGMGGWGQRIYGPDGETRVVGEQWNETHNYNAAGTFARNHAMFTVVLSIALVTIPDESPIETVAAYYQARMPSPQEFQKEAVSFEPHWRNVQEKLVFVDLCKDLANGDPAFFASAINYAFTADYRNEFIKAQASDIQQAYREKLEKLPQFNPPQLPTHFERRFTSYTTPQLEAMLDDGFSLIEGR